MSFHLSVIAKSPRVVNLRQRRVHHITFKILPNTDLTIITPMLSVVDIIAVEVSSSELKNFSAYHSVSQQKNFMSTGAKLSVQTMYLTLRSVSVYQLLVTRIILVDSEIDLVSDAQPFFYPKYTHQVSSCLPIIRTSLSDL